MSGVFFSATHPAMPSPRLSENRFTLGPLGPRAISKYSLPFWGLTSMSEEASPSVSSVALSMMRVSRAVRSVHAELMRA